MPCHALPLLGAIGWTGALVLLGIVVLLFGSSRIPRLARGLGGIFTEFRRGMRHGVENRR